MKKIKKTPNWIVRSMKHGEEDYDLCAILVGIWALSIACIISFFVLRPFEDNYLIFQIVGVVIVLLVLGWFSRWLIRQVLLLDLKRKRALIRYMNSETEEEVLNSELELKRLCVHIYDSF